MRKPTKTISGVTPLAVMLKPRKCSHGICSYCPTLDVPQSYTPKSPVVMRASQLNYDAEKQVKARLKSFEVMGHETSKIELIIMGGTFLEYPRKYKLNFIKGIYDGLNGIKSKNLEDAKKGNEKAEHRCIGLCIETRPDKCGKKEINEMLSYGATRVELGVQVLDDKIYEKIKRGHSVKDVVKATQLLKDSGFKVSYHLMPNLVSDKEGDLRLFKKVFDEQEFRPDQIKIYPLTIMPGSELAKTKKNKLYSEDELKELLIKMKLNVPEYCRIMRIMREIHPDYIIDGVKHIHLRRIIQEEMKKLNLKCRCIRCREIGFSKDEIGRIELVIRMYKASNGKEYFISHESNDKILSLMRLRIPYEPFRKEISRRSLLLRELHVFGAQVKIGDKGDIQHKGLGKELLKKAEEIAKIENCNKIVIISGIGVREYYSSKLGYHLDEPYMSKIL